MSTDVVTVALTAVLIAVTAYYAWQNRRMVVEMRETRKIAVLPKLAADFSMLGPMNPAIRLRNVGPGPALDVDVTITLAPHDPARAEPDVRRWTAKVVVPGEEHEFLPLGGERGGLPQTEALTAQYRELRLTGTMRDALGELHDVNDAFGPLDEWQALHRSAHRRWEADPDRELRKEIESLRRPAEDAARQLAQIAALLGRALSGDDEEPDRE